MNRRILSSIPAALTLAATILTGCSFSESSSNSSHNLFDISSSPFTSSSDSSTNAQEEFENDVADYTHEFVGSSTGTMDQFREHLSELAKDHGITNWESDLNTYTGIGRGLKKAKLSKPLISAFTESISDNDSMKKQAIEDGMKK